MTYDDGCLRFTGSEKYAKYCSYVENNLRDVEARVTSISMADDSLDEATLTWELDARNDIGRVGVDVEATYKMNLITGRVLEHRERWVVNPSRTEAQAGPLLESTRKRRIAAQRDPKWATEYKNKSKSLRNHCHRVMKTKGITTPIRTIR